MNLIIDIGNSSTKIAIYSNGIKINAFRTVELRREYLEKIISGLTIQKAILSSTGSIPSFFQDLPDETIPYIHILSNKSKFPFNIEYETPESLGTDRIAAVAGAYNLFPGSETLIIDAGTAITYDFLSGSTYKGGNISPGIGMRFRALNAFTGNLPMVSSDENFISPGRNTKDAIAAGVVVGVIYEINEYIRTFEKNHIDFKIVLTGGDSCFIGERIDHEVLYLPDIVPDGLNFLLEYNAT